MIRLTLHLSDDNAKALRTACLQQAHTVFGRQRDSLQKIAAELGRSLATPDPEPDSVPVDDGSLKEITKVVYG